MASYVAGIDFGTSNSSTAITNGGVPRLVDVENGRNTIPTALYFPENQAKFFMAELPNKNMWILKQVVALCAV